jgi:hypothetical protein
MAMHKQATCIVTVFAVMAAMGCGRTDWRTTPLSPQPLSSPSSGNSLSPQMTTSGRGLILSWLERTGETTTLNFAERSPSGWTAPVMVTSGKLVTNYADVPSVLRMSDGTLAAHWTKVTDPRREGTDLLLSFSKDDGRTWSPPVSPHHDGTPTQHAFATLFELPTKRLGVIWLDARAYDLDQTDDLSLRYAAFDTSWKQTADQPIDGRVCECCPTSAVVTADGVLTAYRNRSDDEVRNIYTSRLEGGTWTQGQPVHDDGWMIQGCPVNGPMLSAHGPETVVAWFTSKNDIGQAYAAFSSDAGRSWGNPIRLDEAGSLGRVGVVLLDDGSAVASWIEVTDKHAQFRIRRLDRSGTRSPAATVTDVPMSVTSAYPRMARFGDELVFAWTERASSKEDDAEGAQHVGMAVARVPR